jgi:putative sugar O-methyltransferase
MTSPDIASCQELFRAHANSVLFVTSQLRPRELKMAAGLRRLGWKVGLIYYKWTPFDPHADFDFCFAVGSVDEALTLAKRLAPRVSHVFSGAIDDLMLQFCRWKPSPVVIDLNDVFAPSLFNYCHERFEPTREALALADGFCARDLQVKSAERLDGFRLPSRLVFFPEYCWNTTPISKGAADRAQSGDVHVVSVGTFSFETQGMYDSCYLRLATMLVEQQIHLHIYPHWAYRRDHTGSPHANFEKDFADFLSLQKTNPYLHLHESLPIEDLAKVLPQYDFGIVSGGAEQFGQKLGFYHPAYLETCYSGRISDYLDARLPVLINDEVKFDYWLLKRYGICVDLKGVLRPGFKKILLNLKRDPRQSEIMKRAAQKLSVDFNTPRLGEFYQQVIAAGASTFSVNRPMKTYHSPIEELCETTKAASLATGTNPGAMPKKGFSTVVKDKIRWASPRLAKILLPYRAMRIFQVRLHNALQENQTNAAAIATLHARIDSLEHEAAQFRAQVAVLEQDKMALNANRLEHEQDKTLLNNQVEDLTQLKTALSAQVAGLKQDKATLNAKLACLEQDKADLTAYVTRLEQDTSALSAQVAGLAQAQIGLRAQITGVEQDKATLNDNLEGLEQDKADLTTYVTRLEQDTSALSAQVAGLAQAQIGLHAQITGVEQDKTVLSTRVTELEQIRAALSASVAGLEQDKVALRTQLTALEADKEEFRTHAVGLKQDNAALGVKVAALKHDKDALSTQVADLSNENVKLRSQAEEIQQSNDALHVQLENFKKEIEALTRQLHVLSNEKFILQKETRWGKISINEIAGVLNWPEVLDDVERTSGFTDFVHVMGLFTGNTNVPNRPSACWDLLALKNYDQLLSFGYNNFKRTVGNNYFNFLVQKGDPQIQALEALLPQEILESCDRTARSLPEDPTFPGLDQFCYKYFVLLLWEYAKGIDGMRYFENLNEPEEGNPIIVLSGGQKVSQDLSNSLIEYCSISESVDFEHVDRVLDIGGGYGRNAYVILKLNPHIKVTLVDIPPALYIAQRYLSSIFKEQRVFKARNFSRYDEVKEELEDASIVFLMPYQLSFMPEKRFDLCINISSFGEMNIEQIKWYFKQLGRVTGKYFYTKQWRNSNNIFDEVVLGQSDYAYPENWEMIFSRPCRVQTEFFEALYQVSNS